jgi:serine/threonine-protein kinase RsbW
MHWSLSLAFSWINQHPNFILNLLCSKSFYRLGMKTNRLTPVGNSCCESKSKTAACYNLNIHNPYMAYLNLSNTFIFSARFENLEKICDFVDEIAKQSGFDEMARYSIKTAVDEACSNIIDHAYGGEGRGDIECTCNPIDDEIKIILKDHGRSFDPETIPEPDLSSPIEDRKERGLGLYFMHKLMDEIHFDFSEKTGNVLTMVKHRERNI